MDELFLSKVRLAVVAELLAAEWVSFTELQRSTEATNGNLGAHLGKLIEAGSIKEQKRFEGRRPQQENEPILLRPVSFSPLQPSILNDGTLKTPGEA